MFRLLSLSKSFSKAGQLTITAKGLKSGTQPVVAQMPQVKSHPEITMNHPLQALLVALATCQTHTAFYHAKKSAIDLKQIDWNKITSSYDPAGWIAGTQTNQILGDIDIDVEVTSSSDRKSIEELMHKVERLCPVYRTLEAAGIKIKQNLTVKK